MEKNKIPARNTWEMSIRAGEFEKALSLINCIYAKIDFSKKQDITIMYRPGEKTEITFLKVE